MADQDRIELLHVIRDTTHKQDEKMQSTMAYVNKFLGFSTIYQDHGDGVGCAAGISPTTVCQ